MVIFQNVQWKHRITGFKISTKSSNVRISLHGIEFSLTRSHPSFFPSYRRFTGSATHCTCCSRAPNHRRVNTSTSWCRYTTGRSPGPTLFKPCHSLFRWYWRRDCDHNALSSFLLLHSSFETQKIFRGISLTQRLQNYWWTAMRGFIPFLLTVPLGLRLVDATANWLVVVQYDVSISITSFNNFIVLFISCAHDLAKMWLGAGYFVFWSFLTTQRMILF